MERVKQMLGQLILGENPASISTTIVLPDLRWETLFQGATGRSEKPNDQNWKRTSGLIGSPSQSWNALIFLPIINIDQIYPMVSLNSHKLSHSKSFESELCRRRFVIMKSLTFSPCNQNSEDISLPNLREDYAIRRCPPQIDEICHAMADRYRLNKIWI
jgi:hypothetical protein